MLAMRLWVVKTTSTIKVQSLTITLTNLVKLSELFFLWRKHVNFSPMSWDAVNYTSRNIKARQHRKNNKSSLEGKILSRMFLNKAMFMGRLPQTQWHLSFIWRPNSANFLQNKVKKKKKNIALPLSFSNQTGMFSMAMLFKVMCHYIGCTKEGWKLKRLQVGTNIWNNYVPITLKKKKMCNPYFGERKKKTNKDILAIAGKTNTQNKTTNSVT